MPARARTPRQSPETPASPGSPASGALSAAAHASAVPDRLTGTAVQPISQVQWIDPSLLRANAYNPNEVFPPELALLKTSILEDGWTQPIVIRADHEIVDGFHRWTLGSTDADVRALTGGLVPVVFSRPDLTPAQQRMSTIRHNRARGEHAVLKMSDIVRELIDVEHVPRAELETRLGMEDEEIDRLYDSALMPERGAPTDDFNPAWEPG